MANALGADVETRGLQPPKQNRQSHQETLKQIVTGNTLTSTQKNNIMNQAFTQDKFKAVGQVQKARAKLADDISGEVELIKQIYKEMEDFGWEGKDAEMSKLAINTLISQVEKQLYSKVKTGKLKLEIGPGELLAGADIISRGLEMGGGYHIGKTHDDIDKFWNDTKLNYIPVVGGIAESLSHIVGSLYNDIAVNAYGKETDDEKLAKLQYKLKGAQSRLNNYMEDTGKLEKEADKYVKAEKSRYNQQRNKLSKILNKTGAITRQDEAYINLEKYRDFY